jgi:hypothetical protein
LEQERGSKLAARNLVAQVHGALANQRQVVAVIRERGGRTLPAVVAKEIDSPPSHDKVGVFATYIPE